MMRNRFILLLLGVVLLGMNSLEALPAQVIVIRHGEKPPEGDKLSLKGEERAAALAPFFLGTSTWQQFGSPVALFAQGISKENTSIRPIQTLQPLANALNQIVLSQYTRQEYQDMADDIKSNPDYEKGLVIVALEHDTIPLMVTALGGDCSKHKWRGDVFDRLWVVTYKPNGEIDFQDLPQCLLFGDSVE